MSVESTLDSWISIGHKITKLLSRSYLVILCHFLTHLVNDTSSKNGGDSKPTYRVSDDRLAGENTATVVTVVSFSLRV